MLDLGCGSRDQAVPIEYLGFKYVGFDISGTSADFLADAHAIPFKGASFECVFAYAVLEHINNPWLALSEVSRVLKLGGIFIGSISHGEPFHASYFRMTPWGVLSFFSTISSMTIKKIWGNADTLWSLGIIGRYPRVIRSLIYIVNWMHDSLPFLAPRRMRWSDVEKRIDSMYWAGNVFFVVEKSH